MPQLGLDRASQFTRVGLMLDHVQRDAMDVGGPGCGERGIGVMSVWPRRGGYGFREWRLSAVRWLSLGRELVSPERVRSRRACRRISGSHLQ